MDKDRIKIVIRVLSIMVYAGAGIYMLVRALHWFHKWDLPLWQWIAAIVVLPITTIVVPFYAGFTEGDWSMVVAWVVGLAVYAAGMLYSEK